MLPKVAHIDHFIRGRTWVSPTFGRDEIEKRDTGIENCKSSSHVKYFDADETVSFTPEEIEAFKKDHQAYQAFRKGKSPPVKSMSIRSTVC